jgi:hypothetical protein
MAVLAIGAPARAQEILLKGGYTAPKLAVETSSGPPQSTRPLPGAIAGISTFLTSGRGGGFQVEVLVRELGAHRVITFTDELRMLAIDIPLLLHVDYWVRGDNSLYISGGPSAMALFRQTYRDTGGSATAPEIKRVDVAINVSTGIEVGALVIDWRYTRGLREILNADARGFRNRAWALTAGIRWR